MKKIEKTYSWKTISELIVVATSTLTLSETVYADGDKIEIDACKMSFRLEVESRGVVGNYIVKLPQTINGIEYPAHCGPLVISQDNLDQIDRIIAEVEAHPIWTAQQALIEKNQKEITEMDKRRRGHGYCTKCESYCFGECGL